MANPADRPPCFGRDRAVGALVLVLVSAAPDFSFPDPSPRDRIESDPQVMPNTKSAKKRMHQSERQRLVNRAVKNSIKSLARKVRESAAKSPEEAASDLRLLARKVDKAAAHGVIHGNRAARLKSRLSAVVKHAKQAPKPEAGEKPKATKAAAKPKAAKPKAEKPKGK